MFGWMQHRAVRDEVEQRTRPEGGDTDGLDLYLHYSPELEATIRLALWRVRSVLQPSNSEFSFLPMPVGWYCSDILGIAGCER